MQKFNTVNLEPKEKKKQSCFEGDRKYGGERCLKC